MKEYKINKNNHYSQFNPRLHCGITSIERTVKFTESCLYQPINKDYKEDINKLFGWSMGYHKRDSVRFGWEPEENKSGSITGRINLYGYIYSNWVREFRLIQQVEINKPYVFAIRTSRSKMFESKPLAHTFSVYDGGGFIDFFMQGKEPYMKHGYILNPYFGGDEPAQHDTIIKMSKAIIS